MIDGPTEATDLEPTEQNKNFVRQFVEDILVNGKLDKLAGYYNGDNYTQHNPQIADGLSGLGQALQAMAEQGITMKYDKIHKVLGEGNFVLGVSEGSFAGQPTSFYDLFPRRKRENCRTLGHNRNHPAAERLAEPERQVLTRLRIEFRFHK